MELVGLVYVTIVQCGIVSILKTLFRCYNLKLIRKLIWNEGPLASDKENHVARIVCLLQYINMEVKGMLISSI